MHRWSVRSLLLVSTLCLFQSVVYAQSQPAETNRSTVSDKEEGDLSLLIGGPLAPAGQADVLITQVEILAAEPAEVKGKRCPVSISFRGRIHAASWASRKEIRVRYHFFGDKFHVTFL